MKRIAFFITLLALTGLSQLSVNAQSGTTGPLSWSISDSTLTITGSGAMPNYSYGNSPWYSYQTSISTVIIGDNVTSIGNDAFQNCSGLTSVIIGSSVTNIGARDRKSVV